LINQGDGSFLTFQSPLGSLDHYKKISLIAPNLQAKINLYQANKNQNMINKVNLFATDNYATQKE